MRRREFIKKTGMATAAAFAVPYILPSGRLFAGTGGMMAKHVVYVMFAGGVRQQESVLQRYLDDSQGMPYAGNIMYNMMEGGAPSQKIVYGTGAGGISPIPAILSQSLQRQGTLFPEVRSGSAGHYTGMNELLQGSSALTQGLKQKPVNPTIFEYLRRHSATPASKVWFVGNGINGSLPLLNYSEHPNYGPKYGANFFAPLVTFGPKGKKYFSDAKIYHPQEQLSPMYEMKYFLDNSFTNVGKPLPNLGNTETEKQDIKAFMKSMFAKTDAGTIAYPPVSDNGDAMNIGYACELMQWFKPTLTVVNLSSVDGCHSNFTGYLASLHRADHAVGHLWNYIQTQIPEMAGNTIIIASPECGRNLKPNGIKDLNDWYAYDHSDQNALRIFTLMAGNGVQSNLVVGSENNPKGLSTDGVLTIAEILGIKSDVMAAGLVNGNSMSLFDRI
jgi:hypothetical protein